MQDCCNENWLLKAVEFGNCQEHFLEILLDLHRLPIVVNLIGYSGESLDNMYPEFGSTNISAEVERLMFDAWKSDGEDLKSRVRNEIRHDDPDHYFANQLTEEPSLSAPPEVGRHVTEFDFLKTPCIYRGGGNIFVFPVTFSNKEFVIKMRCSKPEVEKLKNSQDITLKHEANIMKKCRHPYAVGLLGYWEVTRAVGPEVPLLLMEFMECNLKEVIQRNRKAHRWGGTRGFPALDAINLMLPVAKVMRHLHRNGFVHRDLKPQNILFTHASETDLKEDFSVKLADFGEAQKVGGCGEGFRVGTTGYMDPGVWRKSATVDLFKADVFSFGMVFGEVLTGLSPPEALHCMFGSGDGAHVQARKFYEKLDREERPPLPKATPKFVKSIIESCWASSPAERPSFEEICWKLQNTENLLVNRIEWWRVSLQIGGA